MIRRQHMVSDFFDGASELHETLDQRFKNASARGIDWQYFCDPRLYTYFRTAPQSVFDKALFDHFMQRLRQCASSISAMVPMGTPKLHLMVNGCKLELHSDFHNGAWAMCYSLTRWDRRRFCGGETLLLKDGVPATRNTMCMARCCTI
jgi:hypothetical protein